MSDYVWIVQRWNPGDWGYRDAFWETMDSFEDEARARKSMRYHAKSAWGMRLVRGVVVDQL